MRFHPLDPPQADTKVGVHKHHVPTSLIGGKPLRIEGSSQRISPSTAGVPCNWVDPLSVVLGGAAGGCRKSSALNADNRFLAVSRMSRDHRPLG